MTESVCSFADCRKALSGSACWCAADYDRRALGSPEPLTNPYTLPMNNAVGAVVTSMGPQNVDTVLIAGKVMKRNGQLVGVDFGRLARLGDEARDRLYASANVENTRI
jgi:hypothetical protein